MAPPRVREPELTPREAITKFEKAVQQSPDAMTHFNLGSAYYVAHDLDAALKELQEAVALSPDLDHAHYYLGVIYKSHGEADKARLEFDKVVQGNSNFMLKNQARMQMRELESN